MSTVATRPMSLRNAARIVAAAAAVVLITARPADAQGVFESVERFSAAIVVDEEGRLHVTETINYDFGNAARHGIYRYIPVRYHYDRTHDRVYPLEGIEVTSASGAPTNVDISNADNNKVIRIGDPDRTITGRHQYTIRYVVDGTLNHFEDHDELYWNITGNGWDVPIQLVEATVELPVLVRELTCFAGPERSSLPCGRAVGEGSTTATFGASDLSPHSGLTIVIGVRPRVISGVGPILEERWSLDRAFARTPRAIAGAVAVTALLGFLLVRMLWRHGRDRRLVADGDETRIPAFEDESSPVRYRPPEDLRPAQVGVLVDEKADPLDVSASIVDLAVRGFISIEEIPDRGLFSKRDWRLRRANGGDDRELQVYEHRLRDALFEDGDTVLMSELKNNFYDDLKQIQDDLYDDCVRKGWFLRRPDRTRTLWFAVGIAATIVGGVAVAAVAAKTHAGLVALPLPVAGLVLLIAHGRMPARTGTGTRTLQDVLGFRRFMSEAQTERMQFAEEEGIFAKYLPYAIVFGITKQWAKRFADLGANAPAMTGMGWYVGPAFNPADFCASMNDFTIHTAGTIVSTPPSASGGSGFGGFSGGGGGGGGGGSW